MKSRKKKNKIELDQILCFFLDLQHIYKKTKIIQLLRMNKLPFAFDLFNG